MILIERAPSSRSRQRRRQDYLLSPLSLLSILSCSCITPVSLLNKNSYSMCMTTNSINIIITIVIVINGPRPVMASGNITGPRRVLLYIVRWEISILIIIITVTSSIIIICIICVYIDIYTHTHISYIYIYTHTRLYLFYCITSRGLGRKWRSQGPIRARRNFRTHMLVKSYRKQTSHNTIIK